jgi:hypothetical protein
MIQDVTVTLALKLLLAPLLVVLSSLAARRWGPAAAGLLIALPVVAGPILLITTLEQGRRFGASAAGASLLGLVTLALFACVYAWVSRLLGWATSLAVSWTACLLTDLALNRLSPATPSPVIGLAVTLLATAAAVRLMPASSPAVDTEPSMPPAEFSAPAQASAPAPPFVPPVWDLPARALATALLVLALTDAAAGLGPTLTGILAPFPIASSVVAAFTRAQLGPAATTSLLRGVLRGLPGFAVFCFLVASLLVARGPSAAFSLAVAGTLTLQGALSLLPRHRVRAK